MKPVVPLVMVNAFWVAQRALSHSREPKLAERWAARDAVLPLVLCIPLVLFYTERTSRTREPPP